jgi:hypothetical protein
MSLPHYLSQRAQCAAASLVPSTFLCQTLIYAFWIHLKNYQMAGDFLSCTWENWSSLSQVGKMEQKAVEEVALSPTSMWHTQEKGEEATQNTRRQPREHTADCTDDPCEMGQRKETQVGYNKLRKDVGPAFSVMKHVGLYTTTMTFLLCCPCAIHLSRSPNAGSMWCAGEGICVMIDFLGRHGSSVTLTFHVPRGA